MTGELAPDFRCPKGHSTGARRESADGPWLPQPCWVCQQKELASAAAKRRKLGNVAAGVDLDKAFAAYRKLPPFAGNLGRHVKLTVAHNAEGRAGGHAKTYSRKLHVSYGPHATPAEVLEVLMHEMCHLAVPRSEHHGERFRLTLRRAARELWGIHLPLLIPRRGEKNLAYALDREIVARLTALVQAGTVDLFPPDPPKERPSREDRTRALVEKRAAHAVRMYEKAKRREAAARYVRRRWLKKVRYYEKAAAKRGSS